MFFANVMIWLLFWDVSGPDEINYGAAVSRSEKNIQLWGKIKKTTTERERCLWTFVLFLLIYSSKVSVGLFLRIFRISCCFVFVCFFHIKVTARNFQFLLMVVPPSHSRQSGHQRPLL